MVINEPDYDTEPFLKNKWQRLMSIVQSVILEEKLLKRAFGRVNSILCTVAYYNYTYIYFLPLSSIDERHSFYIDLID